MVIATEERNAEVDCILACPLCRDQYLERMYQIMTNPEMYDDHEGVIDDGNDGDDVVDDDDDDDSTDSGLSTRRVAMGAGMTFRDCTVNIYMR